MKEKVSFINKESNIQKRTKQESRWKNYEIDSVEIALAQYQNMIWDRIHHSSTKTNTVCNEEDLYQEGCLAILEAYNAYDPKHETTLCTWTCRCINDAIVEYQKHNLSCLSGVAYLHDRISYLKRIDEEVTVENLVKKAGMRYKTASMLETYLKSFEPEPYGIGTTIRFQNIEEGSYVEFEAEKLAAADLFEKAERFRFEDYKSYLSEEECFIIEKYFGFEDEKWTMNKIGNCINKSRKAVAYAMNKALSKLRSIPGIEYYRQQ